MKYHINLYSDNGEGSLEYVRDALWKTEYTKEEALELLASIMNNKFSFDISSIVISTIEECTELPPDPVYDTVN